MWGKEGGVLPLYKNGVYWVCVGEISPASASSTTFVFQIVLNAVDECICNRCISVPAEDQQITDLINTMVYHNFKQ